MNEFCKLTAGVLLVMTTGCMPSPSTTPEDADATSLDVTAEEAKPRETVGKTTQNVLALDAALADGGVVASTKIESKNPLMQSADAYRTTVGKIGGMGVEHAIQIRNAQSIKEPQPLTHQKLMDEIIKKGDPNGVRLPMLPYYQEYTWDEAAQKLVIVDFPARQVEREENR